MIDPDDRSWEDRYRSFWSWEDTARVTHPQDCYPGNCSFVAYLEDGEVIREEQTGRYPVVDPDTPDWNPRGCNKGCLYSDVTYGEERIERPMVQTGERGSGEWEAISWEEAFERIADALIDAVEENPQSIVLEPPVEGGTFQAMAPILLLINALGGTVLDEVAEISDFSAGQYMTFGKFHAASTQDEWFKADVNLIWHANPVYTRIPAYHFLTENRYGGGEVVTIAPDFSPSCVHADRYVPVEPASDSALALGMARVMIEEDWVDTEFVREQTDLPLLVRTDTGRFLREADLEEEGGERTFYVWDERAGKLTEAPRESLDLGEVEPALEGTREVTLEDGTTVEVRPVMVLLKRRLREDYDLETVREITGVAPEVVRELAETVAHNDTNILVGFNTCKTFHGDLIERTMALVLALSGNWGKPGTGIRSWCVFSEPGMPFGEDGDGFESLAQMTLDGEAVTEEELSIRASMLQAKFGFPTVPPVFFWNDHAGFGSLWEGVDPEGMSLPRGIPDYLEEAREQGWWRNLDRPDPDVDPSVMIAMGNNTLRRTRGGTRTLLEELWSKLDTIVTVDFRWSTTALYSDIVLPAAFFYEKEQFHMLTSSENRFWAYGERAIDPVHESRTEWEMVHRLTQVLTRRAEERGLETFSVPHGVTPEDFEELIGRRMNLPDELVPLMGATRRYDAVEDVVTQGGTLGEDTVEDALESIVERCVELGMFGSDESLDTIRERGFVKYEDVGHSAEGHNMATDVEPNETVTPYRHHVEDARPYPTLTRRAQFYVDHPWFLEADEALPVHKDPPNQGGDYPFRMDSGHQRWSIHASTVTNEQMAQTHRGEPFLFVNEEDADRMDLGDGAYVRVHNDHGSFCVQAKRSALPEPGQVIIYHAWDPHQYEDWRSYDHVIPGLIKPLHLAGGYGHLNYWISNWQPQQVDRHVQVDLEPLGDSPCDA